MMLLLCAALVLGTAWAQDDDDPLDGIDFAPASGSTEALSTPTMSFDTVLVATVQPDDETLLSEADRITDLLVDSLSQTNEVLTVADVRDFDTRGYTARRYMLACPDGDYAGCALVCGQRGEADWALGGTLLRLPSAGEDDDGEPLEGRLQLTITFVDVRDSREVLSFAVDFDGEDDADVMGGIGVMFDRILAGAFEELDVRGDLDDPAIRAQIERARQEIIAQGLTELEESLGAVQRTVVEGTLEQPRVTRAELEEYNQRDDVPPWVKVGLTQQQYLRYSNSGLQLRDWRIRAMGRQFQIVARAWGAFGRGPYAHRFEGRVARDSTTLTPAHIEQVQEAVQGGQTAGFFELGFGVLPWLEVGGHYGIRGSRFTICMDEETVDQVNVVGNPTESGVSGREIGGYLLLAPGPHWIARPTGYVGYAAWKGKTFQPAPCVEGDPKCSGNTSPLRTLAAPTQGLLLLAPGIEVSPDKILNLVARGMVEVPLGGSPVAQFSEGSGLLSDIDGGAQANPCFSDGTPKPSGDRGVGWSLQLGVEVRLGPLFGRPNDGVRTDFGDDEL
ncbi:MAG: hypothetical protein ACI8PZ_000777 [Myxococcota bacterium]|jgi:hypothetical protein